ncbi:MAG: hypothetical protein OES84_05245 [Kiritimatiellaceae bacterium]|nr:hypothetical protein [Kiritimatiellaceae bacterium]
MRNWILWVMGVGMLAGCASFHEASVEDGVIHNPETGWAGYSVEVPDGLVVVYPASDDAGSARALEFLEWYRKQTNHYGWEWYTTFTEQFLMEDRDKKFILSFVCDTFDLPAPSWSSMPSVQRQYALHKMINRKKVVINDMKAHGELIEINGKRGWYISGLSRPYFKREVSPLAYEGFFIAGGLREAYWVEAFGDPALRGKMKVAARAMVESLEFDGGFQR